MKSMLIAVFATVAMVPPTLAATSGRFEIPPTVSPEAARGLTQLYGVLAANPPPATPPKTVADWDRRAALIESLVGPAARANADRLNVTTRADRMGGISVLRIAPPGYRPGRRTLLYVHGGGYVFFDARSTLTVPALIAVATGDEVVSVNYTLAPRGTWKTAPDEVIAVYKGMLAAGHDPRAIGILGDSAGGALAAGAVLKMRDDGVPLPGALYLLSPWSDITDTGDSYRTLADADPILSSAELAAGAAAYAAPAEQHEAYVSPVYGDYSKPFPPTLIQGGTREIFLSNFVRHYQAIRSGGHPVELDLYEGMPHVFPALIPDTPETRSAIAHAVQFLDRYLALRSPE